MIYKKFDYLRKISNKILIKVIKSKKSFYIAKKYLIKSV